MTTSPEQGWLRACLQNPGMKLAWSPEATRDGKHWIICVAARTLYPDETASATGMALVRNQLIPASYEDVVQVRLVDSQNVFGDDIMISKGSVPLRLDVVLLICGKASVDLLKQQPQPILLSASAFMILYAESDDQSKAMTAIQNLFQK